MQVISFCIATPVQPVQLAVMVFNFLKNGHRLCMMRFMQVPAQNFVLLFIEECLFLLHCRKSRHDHSTFHVRSIP